jgi:predicted nucleic acid-binding protein
MILVDTTVWIHFFNGQVTAETEMLDELLGREEIIMGDIILAEVLQGFRSDQDFEAALQALAKIKPVSMLNPELAVRSARNYRLLRKEGITIRKTVDCFIATFCIENHIDLLHCDHDFDPFEQILGLQVIHPILKPKSHRRESNP